MVFLCSRNLVCTDAWLRNMAWIQGNKYAAIRPNGVKCGVSFHWNSSLKCLNKGTNRDVILSIRYSPYERYSARHPDVVINGFLSVLFPNIKHVELLKKICIRRICKHQTDNPKVLVSTWNWRTLHSLTTAETNVKRSTRDNIFTRT